MPLTKPAYGSTGWGPVVDAIIDWYNANENGFIVANSSVTDAKVASTAAISADKLVDGTSGKVLTAAERTKLSGVASGATVNATDVQLRDRSSHTGTQPVSSITDFTKAVQDIVGAMFVQGSNVTLSYNSTAGTLTVSSTGGGTGGLDAEAVRDTIGAALVQGTNININVNDAADTITFSTIATVNSTDAQLRDRATHTGTQAISSVSGLQAALDSKAAAGSASSASPVIITYAASITPNAASGSLFRCVATGNLTLNDPINGTEGQHVTIEILASGADRTLAFAGNAAAAVVIPAGLWWSGSCRYHADITTWIISDGYGNVVVGGGAVVADASTSAKGVARILGGTADAPTVPWGSITNAPNVPSTEDIQDVAAILFTSGQHTGLTATYNDAANRIDLAVTASGGGSTGYATLQDEGSVRTQRQIVNFVGNGVTVTDDPAFARTTVTVPGVDQSVLDVKVDSTGIDTIVTISQAAYDSLSVKDSRTLYVITS